MVFDGLYYDKLLAICNLCRISENYELLKTRRHMILCSKEGLELDVKEQTSINRTHVANMNSLKPEIKRLHKLRDVYKKSVHAALLIYYKHFLLFLY